MAIGWMTVLKLVPWGEVIKNAPAVADGARKLWDTVGRKGPAPPPAPAGGADAAATAALPDETPLAQLQGRVARAEAELETLHEQMQASSALIKALAEQNTELIRRVEIQRVRLWWLVAVLAVFGAIAGLNLAVELSR